MLLLEIKKINLSGNFSLRLFENRMDFIYNSSKDQLIKRFETDNRVPNHYRDKLANGDVAKNLISHFADIDPSRKKIYVQWIINMYLKNSMLEDIDKLKTGLVLFDKFKQKLQNKDINRYKSINSLLIAVDEFKDEEYISVKQAKAQVKNDEVEYIINTPTFKVLIPKTHKASCMYGSNTKWCTTTKDDDTYFEQYSSDGPLYIILAGSGTNVKKFQLHYESEQFLNANDDALSQTEIDYLSKFNQYKDFLDMIIKKHYKFEK